MKVVMLHDSAYVGAAFAKWLRRMGVEVKTMLLQSVLKTTRVLRSIDADLVHAHYARVPAWAALLSGKRFVVHCHGDDIRHGYSLLNKLALKKASLILHSTPDLEGLVKRSVYLPNPVDTELFQPRRNVVKVKRALYFTHQTAHPKTRGEEPLRGIVDACREADVEVTILPKGSAKYEDMPSLLPSYDMFLDHWMCKAYSKTVLEAMRMCIPVIGYETPLEELKQKIIAVKENPKPLIERGLRIVEEHKPEKVAAKLNQLYLTVLKK